jgi:hypothetical protein
MFTVVERLLWRPRVPQPARCRSDWPQWLPVRQCPGRGFSSRRAAWRAIAWKARLAGAFETAKFKTVIRSGYRLSAPRRADVQLRAIFLKHGDLYRKHGKRQSGRAAMGLEGETADALCGRFPARCPTGSREQAPRKAAVHARAATGAGRAKTSRRRCGRLASWARLESISAAERRSRSCRPPRLCGKGNMARGHPRLLSGDHSSRPCMPGWKRQK